MEEEKKQLTISTDKSKMGHLIDLLDNKRPVGWGKKSYAPYYKKMYAEWLRKDIDAMLEHRQPILYDIRKFPDISNQALYNRINQGLLFLLEPRNGLDPDGKYAQWRATINIKRVDAGVRIAFDEVLEGGAQAEIIKGEELQPKWKRNLDAYLQKDNPESKPFYQGSLALSDEEVETLENELSGLANVVFSINNYEVKVVKSI